MSDGLITSSKHTHHLPLSLLPPLSEMLYRPNPIHSTNWDQFSVAYEPAHFSILEFHHPSSGITLPLISRVASQQHCPVFLNYLFSNPFTENCVFTAALVQPHCYIFNSSLLHPVFNSCNLSIQYAYKSPHEIKEQFIWASCWDNWHKGN